MTNSQKVLLVIFTIVFCVGVRAMCAWLTWHDEAMLRAADKYEACIIKEYGMHPAGWYDIHGEYPICHAK